MLSFLSIFLLDHIQPETQYIATITSSIHSRYRIVGLMLWCTWWKYSTVKILNKDSDTNETQELGHAARWISKEVLIVNSKMFINVWSIPKGYSPVLVFPQDSVQCISVIFRDHSLD